MFTLPLVLAILFLLALFFLQTLRLAVLALEELPPELLSTYRRFQQLFFTSKEREALLFHLNGGAGALRFCYAASVIFFVLFGLDLHSVTLGLKKAFVFEDFSWLWTLITVVVAIAAELIVGEFLPRWWVYHAPQKAHSTASFAATLTLFILFPFTFLLSRPLKKELGLLYTGKVGSKESQHSFGATAEDKKLLASATAFRKRIVREIMVPRPDMFCLQASTTIREAAARLVKEGYSRIPIYKNNVDNIIGLLLYKDILAVYHEYEESGDRSVLDVAIETLLKPILFAPETSHISHLLQEFRKKQTHLAIVVDEYGGTEGVITIEDCLEEIVGEIADEYDEEELLYLSEPDGNWIIDGRMTLSDVEEKFQIKMPQEGDYDTVAGYVSHCIGEIPVKGVIIHHDDFELEVIESTERSVEKVRLRPIRIRKERD